MEHAAVIWRNLHNQNEGWITRSAEFDFSGKLSNIILFKILKYRPPKAALGPPGGVLAEPPKAVSMNQKLPSLEKNGFLILDVTPDEMNIRFYAWSQTEP